MTYLAWLVGFWMGIITAGVVSWYHYKYCQENQDADKEDKRPKASQGQGQMEAG
jgi:hypothetical protein